MGMDMDMDTEMGMGMDMGMDMGTGMDIIQMIEIPARKKHFYKEFLVKPEAQNRKDE